MAQSHNLGLIASLRGPLVTLAQIATQVLVGASGRQQLYQGVGSPSQEVAWPLYSRRFEVLLATDHCRKGYGAAILSRSSKL